MPQSKDTGLALVLVCLLAAYFGEYRAALLLGIIMLVRDHDCPYVVRPLGSACCVESV